jgi:hypothetical protein
LRPGNFGTYEKIRLPNIYREFKKKKIRTGGHSHVRGNLIVHHYQIQALHDDAFRFHQEDAPHCSDSFHGYRIHSLTQIHIQPDPDHSDWKDHTDTRYHPEVRSFLHPIPGELSIE